MLLLTCNEPLLNISSKLFLKTWDSACAQHQDVYANKQSMFSNLKINCDRSSPKRTTPMWKSWTPSWMPCSTSNPHSLPSKVPSSSTTLWQKRQDCSSAGTSCLSIQNILWKREPWLKGYTFFISFVQINCFIVQCVWCHACATEVHQTILLAHYALLSHTLFRLWRDISDFSTLCMDNRLINITSEGVLTLFFLISEIFVFTQSYLILAVQLLGDDEPKLANGTLSNITIFTNICSWIRTCFPYLNYMCMSK